MSIPILKRSMVVLLVVCAVLLPAFVFAQVPRGGLPGPIPHVNIDISVKGPNGAPISEMAVVTLSTLRGGVFKQATTMAGHVEFHDVAASQYSIQVVAPGFEKGFKEFDAEGMGTTMVAIELEPTSGKVDATADAPSSFVLAPKAQKELGKALEALRANKLTEARSHLDAAHHLAPSHPEVNYLFGMYEMMSSDWTLATSYLTKALEFSPRHVGALLSLSEVLLRINKAGDAIPYLNRAVEAEPSSWRVHAVLADAQMQQGSVEEAIKHAERALELGHGQAATVQPLLARALVERGETERAKNVIQDYLRDHPADAAAKKQLESLQAQRVLISSNGEPATTAVAKPLPAAEAVIALPVVSNWLPPDVDERVPAVEPGVACALDDVLRKTEKRVREFVGNVDRFTATESLVHESINKWGLASSPERRKFNYVVSIREVKRGLLNVDEYRNGGPSQTEFPDGVVTSGLPALILIFHPYNIGNFAVTCEGLTRWNGGLAWQVHFRQRADKPKTIRSYKLGLNGTSYDVSLKGRAWIAADTYQIVRLETDLAAPLPEIRLAADHTAIEYGPVHFRQRDVEMWLPQSAEVYYDWRGRRIHRRHSFSNYLLFSVDDKQRISTPKPEEETPPKPADEGSRPNL